jgi:hypothetical protein
MYRQMLNICSKHWLINAKTVFLKQVMCALHQDNVLGIVFINYWTYTFWKNPCDSMTCHTGCSKSHAIHGLLGICVSWTPHFKDIVASTIPELKPPRLIFMGASQGYCVFKSSTHTHTHTHTHKHTNTHTHCKSFRPTFSTLWTGYQLAHCKTCSLT